MKTKVCNKCNKCKKIKSLTEFYKDKYKKLGIRSKCKKCRKIEHQLSNVLNNKKTSSQLARELGVTKQRIYQRIKQKNLSIRKIKKEFNKNLYKDIIEKLHNKLQTTLIPYTRIIKFKNQNPDIWKQYEKIYGYSIYKLQEKEYKNNFSRLYKLGFNIQKITKRYNISYPVVSLWLKRCKIRSKTYNGRQIRKLYTKNIIKHYKQGKSGKEISNYYNVSDALIYNILRENNVKLRRKISIIYKK